jgi:nucleoside triphosphate diphosphatase
MTLDPTDRMAPPVARLVALMARLRDRERGCPWDVEQSFDTIAPYTVEEAYEVADAIQRRSLPDLKDELGDLLFQVVFHARMAEERGAFAFDDVATAIVEKMIRRHPHVFAAADPRSAAAQTVAWEEHKAAERAAKDGDGGALAGVPLALPALARAEKLGRRAAGTGFDWPDARCVAEKIDEEIGELRAETEASAPNRERIADEIGDLLFAVAQFARHVKVDAEAALRAANARFERRFRHVEQGLAAAGRAPGTASLDEMEALWQDAKAKGL